MSPVTGTSAQPNPSSRPRDLTFLALTASCGLSLAEAAVVSGSTIAQVDRWASGADVPPADALAPIVELRARMDAAVEQECAGWNRLGPATLTLPVAGDGRAARAIGWPSAGVHLAVVGAIAARLIEAGVTTRLISSTNIQNGRLGADAYATMPTAIEPQL